MKNWILCFVIFLGICACEKETKDAIPPEITSLSVDATEVVPNDVINVQVSLSDNAALNQVRVRISQAFAKTYTQWEDLSVRDISGTSYEGTFSFIVPDSATAGYYQIATQGADMDGNGTVDSLIYFTVLQPDAAPQLIDFQTKPEMIGNVIYLNSTDTLSFVGQATDDIELTRVAISLQSPTGKALETLNHNTDSVTTWDFGAQSDSIFPRNYDVLPTQLLIKITDSDGNLTRKSFPVEYTP